MSTNIPKLTDDLLRLAIEGLTVIASLTNNTIDDEAVDVLKAVRVVIESFVSHLHGETTEAEVREAYAKLSESLSKNDAAADQALKDKFGPS